MGHHREGRAFSMQSKRPAHETRGDQPRGGQTNSKNPTTIHVKNCAKKLGPEPQHTSLQTTTYGTDETFALELSLRSRRGAVSHRPAGPKPPSQKRKGSRRAPRAPSTRAPPPPPCPSRRMLARQAKARRLLPRSPPPPPPLPSRQRSRRGAWTGAAGARGAVGLQYRARRGRAPVDGGRYAFAAPPG